MGARIELRNLRRTYGRVVAVEDLCLVVEPGEFVTLLGPSGSGKTTTLRMIAGFVRPSAGEVVLDGHTITGVPPFRRNIGIVFQHYALFPHLTVFENIAFPLRMRGVVRAALASRIDQILTLVRLESLAGRYPRQLSGGQQQRVALARALVFEPPVLLMDEPLGALDRKLRQDMQLEIKQIQRQLHITTVYVTHDQEEALALSDRVAVMNRGRIEQAGSPAELYHRPRNTFVAAFVGETNLLTVGAVTPSGAGSEVRTAGGLQFRLREPPAATRASRIAIRPERIAVLDAGTPAEIECDGKVEEVIFAGDTTKYRVRVGGEMLLVKTPNRLRAREYRATESIRVGWNDDDVLLVPDADA